MATLQLNPEIYPASPEAIALTVGAGDPASPPQTRHQLRARPLDSTSQELGSLGERLHGLAYLALGGA